MADKNSFQYGTPVVGDFYYKNLSLEGAALNYVSNNVHIVLVGPRRYGKTSFVIRLLDRMETLGRQTLYSDL